MQPVAQFCLSFHNFRRVKKSLVHFIVFVAALFPQDKVDSGQLEKCKLCRNLFVILEGLIRKANEKS